MPSGIPLISVQPPVKAWWKSRTLWFNLLCAGLAAAELKLELIKDAVPGGLYVWLAFIVPIGNKLLRVITDTGLAFTGDTAPQPQPPAPPSEGGFALVGLVAAVALLSAVLWVAFSIGQRVERADWLQKQTAQQAQAKKQADADLRAADDATRKAQEDASGWRDLAAQLDSELHDARHVPLISAAPRVAAACPTGSGAATPSPAAPEPGPGAISMSAVRLWDSALAGVQLPAGACRSDDPASAACAAAAGVTFEQLWANHIENATRCRVDRGNYARLIDYLQRRQNGVTAP